MGVDILAQAKALLKKEPTNKNFKSAVTSAQYAVDYENYCQAIRFYYDPLNGSLANYDAALSYYMTARKIQFNQHGGVADFVKKGKGSSWSAAETKCYADALSTSAAGKYDFEETGVLPSGF